MPINRAESEIEEEPVRHSGAIQKIGTWIVEHRVASGAIVGGLSTVVIVAALFLGGVGKTPGLDGALNEVAGASETPQAERNSEGVEFSKIDPNELTVDEFYSDIEYPSSYRSRWANKIIQERTTPALLADIANKLATQNRPALGELVPPAPNNTGDEVLDQQTVALYIASIDPNPNEGRKLLASVITPSSPGFEGLKGQLGGGQEYILATYDVARDDTTLPPYETPTFYQSSIGDLYTPNGDPSKFLMQQNTFTGKFAELTLALRDGSWKTVDTILPGDPNWVAKPRELVVK